MQEWIFLHKIKNLILPREVFHLYSRRPTTVLIFSIFLGPHIVLYSEIWPSIRCLRNVHIQREISVYFLLCMIRSICSWKIFICYKAKAKIRLGGSGILRNNKNVMKMNLPKISTLNESYFLWITNKFCPCMTKKWLKFLKEIKLSTFLWDCDTCPRVPLEVRLST